VRNLSSKFPAPLALAFILSAHCALAGVPDTDVWTQVSAAPTPPAPLGGAMVRNDAHGLVLLVGSPAIPWVNSAYQFDGVAWTPVTDDKASELPKATRFAATGDTGRGYSLIFGGVVNGEFSDVTIAYDGQTFQQRSVNQEVDPPERADAALAHLASEDLVVLFGGVNDKGLLNDTWMYDGEVWFRHLGQYGPSPRSGHAMAYDPIREVVLMYGGVTADGPSNETWAFNGTNWFLYTLRGPSPRSGHAMFFDEGRGRVVLVGGLPQELGVEVAQTWEWTGTNWQIIDSQGPTPRIGGMAAYDSERGVAVLFGGVSPAANLLIDTWEFELASPFGPGIETPVGLRPSDITAGFFDDDAFPDVVVTDSLRASIFYFRNLGVSTGGVPRGAIAGGEWNGFAPPDELPLSGAPSKAEAFDLNNDGNIDIVVAIPGGGSGEPGSEFFLGDGLGGFSGAASLLDEFGQDDVQPGDLDNLKDLLGGPVEFTDLAYVSTGSGLVGVVEGNTTGFDPPLVLEVGGEPTRIALGDLNGDGLADLVYTDRAAGTVAVILQRENGNALFDANDRIDFPAGLPGSEPVALVIFDFDGDGDLDVATADSATNTVTALANLGPGKEGWLGLFVTDITPTGANPVSIEAASFFGSGLDDISTANESGNTISVLRNLGGGLFADPLDLGVTQGPVALAAADLNADGLEDLVAASAPPSPPGILTSFLSLGLAPCPGDTDGDRYIGFEDLGNLLEAYGSVGENLPADINGDGIVDFADLNQLLTLYGVTCT
jgi:hypothetical protein